ncbi:conserved exported protein of unknown function [Rhodovastum atsumiense]|uniref:Type II secretion system protein GspC N-terminal domain-containing protein n=1 Tax=Rhodovastum atsumiense TaxID=504468 RepID=A0A5M6IMC0_9PROT|nr:hypothetical protein [Rhodovastum atsumiense]KAA5609401.1 hypothetical protein F1189_24300 [Rhodovastum atsumiense]CAH2601842.1 conserved exported protein of unknown function [Rhodovastum atsumiense]
MIRPALLPGLAALLAALLALELVSAPPQGEDAAPPALPAIQPREPARADAAATLAPLAQAIAARPLFTPGRQPAAAASADRSTAAGEALPRLAGVIVTPDGARAIFAGEHGTLTVPQGGTIGRFVVRVITPGQVILSDAGQLLVLRPRHTRRTSP